MKIGLLGFGVVGRGVYEIAASREDMQVRKVLCLEDISLSDAEAVKDFAEILNDNDIDTVVEAMGGLHPSHEFAVAALKAGRIMSPPTRPWSAPIMTSWCPWRSRWA